MLYIKTWCPLTWVLDRRGVRGPNILLPETVPWGRLLGGTLGGDPTPFGRNHVAMGVDGAGPPNLYTFYTSSMLQ